MLRELVVKNFALIEDAHIEFAPGFNVISGSTGAGKTLVISALTFILGTRAKTDLIRSGQKEARVEAAFEITDKRLIKRLEQIIDAEIPDGELLLKRSFTTDARNRCTAAGSLVTVGTLRKIGALLVDIYSQREHQSLLQKSRQLELLDEFGALSEKRAAFAEKLGQYRDTLRELERRETEKAAVAHDLEFASFQLREIETLSLQSGEEVALEEELNVLASSERIRELASGVYDALYDADPSAITLLKRAQSEIEELAAFAPELKESAEALGNAIPEVEDAALTVRDRVSGLNFDEERRIAVEERLGAIERMKKKHGRDADGLVALKAELKEKCETLASFDRDTASLVADREKFAGGLLSAGRALAEKRKKTGAKLARLTEAQLKDLGMADAKFTVAVEEIADDSQALGRATNAGMGNVEFLIKPNVGEEAKPLASIASGGELSRIMLAIKSVVADVDRTPLLVFDEVDSGIGGRMGEVIGMKLGEVSAGRQVLCITHLPQIAALAGLHLKAEKAVRGKKTYTHVREVSGRERVLEIAEMIRGGGSNVTIKQAEEMLKKR